jgi:hemolysin activation/secretion protein
LATLSVFTPLATAQPDAGSLLQQQQQSMPRPSASLPQADAAPAQILTSQDTQGQTVTLRAVRFSGAEGLATEAELQAAVQGAIGQNIGFAGLEQLAEKVTRTLKDKGWLLTRAYLPQQDLTDGNLEIAILQGRIETDANGPGIDINAAETLAVSRNRVLLTLSNALDLQSERALHAADLERGILLINDTPGIEATSSLERGNTPGTTRLALEVRDLPRSNGSAWVDNYGNRYTGSTRGNALLNINSPAGWGDQINLFFTQSEGVHFGRVGYSVPVGYSGLRANIAASSMTYSIGQEQANQQSRGTGDISSAGLSYPIIRSRSANLNLLANYDHKFLKDETLGANTRNKELQNWTITLSGDRTDSLLQGGINTLSVMYTSGNLDLSRNATDLTNDRASAKTHGNFSKWNASASRLQRVSDTVSLFAGASMQRAGGNLDTSEKFILGGASGVRAYPGGEGSGDNGWLTSLELRYELQALRTWGLGDFQLVGFYDVGRIELQHSPWGVPANNPTQTNSYQLSGAGLGLNLIRPGRYSVRMAWSQPIGDNPGRNPQNDTDADGQSTKERLWISVTVNF